MTGEQIALIALAAIAGFWMVGAYNRLVEHRNALSAALAQVAQLLQRRSAAVLQLLATLREPLHSEQGSLEALRAADAHLRQAVEALQQIPMRGDRAAAVVAAEAAHAASLVRLLALLDQQPALRDAPEVAPHVATIREADERLPFARQVFNESVATYNAAARQFPTRLLTRLYGFGTAGRL